MTNIGLRKDLSRTFFEGKVIFTSVSLWIVSIPEALIGRGRLDQELAMKRGIVSFDNYSDNFCVYWCFAFHERGRSDRLEKAALEIARKFEGDSRLKKEDIKRALL